MLVYAHVQVKFCLQARETHPGCLRDTYGKDQTRNAVHGSDTFYAAEKEIRFMFHDSKMCWLREFCITASQILHFCIWYFSGRAFFTITFYSVL